MDYLLMLKLMIIDDLYLFNKISYEFLMIFLMSFLMILNEFLMSLVSTKIRIKNKKNKKIEFIKWF